MVTWILFALGALIIIGLGLYAGRLLFLLNQQNEKQKQARDKRLGNITESITTIAFAMSQQQCDYSEGVIRLYHLLEALPLEPLPNFESHYPGVYGLYEKIKSFPILEERAALSKKERRIQDREREQIESEYASQIEKDIESLREFNPNGF